MRSEIQVAHGQSSGGHPKFGHLSDVDVCDLITLDLRELFEVIGVLWSICLLIEGNILYLAGLIKSLNYDSFIETVSYIQII
jgi:hypothetical protein